MIVKERTEGSAAEVVGSNLTQFIFYQSGGTMALK